MKFQRRNPGTETSLFHGCIERPQNDIMTVYTWIIIYKTGEYLMIASKAYQGHREARPVPVPKQEPR